MSFEELLTYRRPLVTAIAVPPTGHFFAVGHADGCIAFWAVDDDDMPILVRTVDEIDVHIVDVNKLELILGQDAPQAPHPATPLERKHISKLTWSGFPNASDPRGGETALTVLGGLTTGVEPGGTVLWLPPFNPTG